MEHAKSSKSTCRHCGKNIDKEELRLAFEAQPNDLPDNSTFVGTVPWWHHSGCFFEALPKTQEKFNVPLHDLKLSWFQGTDAVDSATLKELEHALHKVQQQQQQQHGSAKRRQAQHDSDAGAPASKKKKEGSVEEADSQREHKLRAQSQKLWDTKKQLDKASLPELRELLRSNDLNAQGSHETLLERTAEGVLFGALQPCRNCGAQSWHAHKDAYHCHGHADAEAMCDVITRKPDVRPFRLPFDVGSLAKGKHEPGNRCWPQRMTDRDSYDDASLKDKRPGAAKRGASQQQGSMDSRRAEEEREQREAKEEARQAQQPPQAKRSKTAGKLPLQGLHIATAGRLSVPVPKLKEEVRELGGEVDTGDVSDETTCVVVSSPKEVRPGWSMGYR